uniref:Uncharacterized protein n=1 Tax=Cajanus cajan TaxID=3821 RepID=A0A151U3V8_CAJCA|nr:hypothetical protein KK1_006677 [Cajanus cajan]
MDLLAEFHTNLNVLKALLSYFVALVPKVPCLQGMNDFRPISLLGCLYKIIYKVLVNRLHGILPSLISENQSTFIPSKHMLDSFLVIAEAIDFLHCKVGQLLFKYLGLLLGANPRKLSTWKPLLDGLHKCFSSWKHRYLSFGGRVTLINSILNAMPIHCLSFFKALNLVIKEIVTIQRDFLWRDVKDSSRIS